MGITKYASLESAQVLELKGARDKARTASLDKLSDFDEYRTEDGFLYARIRAISSRVNKNHDGWPSVELAGSPEIFERHQASEGGFTVEASKGAEYGFSTFLGKPVFVDHNNSNPDRARGVIVDAKLHVEDHRTASGLDPYYANAPDNHLPPTWVELLLEIDAKSFPKLAKAIIDGSNDPKRGIDGFSMGCDVEKSVCAICKNAATSPDEYCTHVRLKGAHFDYVDPQTGRKTSKRSYEDCYGIKFFEISAVFDPADETALIREVRSSVNKEADLPPWNEGYGRRPPDNSFNPRNPDSFIREEASCDNCYGSGRDASGICPECAGTGRGRLTTPNLNAPYVPGAGGEMGRRRPTYPGLDEYERTLSNVHIAENPLPQADMETAPQAVDTLREEEICPVCGSDFEQGHQCEVCGYVAPPDGLDNPDLQKSQEENPLEQPDPQMPADPQVPPTSTNVGNPGMPTNPGVSANVKIDMSNSWKLFHPRIAGRINPVEKPIVAGNPPASNEPSETIVQDQTQPVTSRTAASMIAAVNNKENMMSRTSADAPTADTRADKRTDVEGVGGVYDGSNEEASKADAQVDVEGVGGTGVEGVAADRTDSIEETSENAGFDKKKNIEGTPTQTWPNKNQHTPVTREPFPASEDGVKKSHDDSPFPPDNENIGGGSANQGTQPVDPVGKAQDRVDVLEHVTSPANNSGPTKTWSGTDGNGVTKQRDPVTNETLVGDDNINLFKDSHIFQAFKLADLEIELGLLNSEYKYARVAELGNETPETIKAQITTLAKVRSAGLRKSTATKRNGIGRVPSFRPTASTKPASESDESLFL